MIPTSILCPHIVTILSGEKESRTPKGFNTSTLFKSVAVANLLVSPIKVLNGLQNLNDELFFGVVVLAKQYPHL